MAPGGNPSILPLPESTEALQRAPRELGPWRLDAVLGRGASSMVYAATHTGSGARRALKVQRILGSNVADRIRREGELQERLRHPGLLAVHACEELDGRLVLVMDLVEGTTLEDWVARHHPLTLAQARALLLPVLEGLDAAHRLGVVHRDLKPANVLLEASGGRPRLGDFGIARLLGEPADLLETQAGLPLGTPGFMAPEQWAQAANAGVRADIFSAGALTWFTLTGRTPFSGADPTALLRATLEGRSEDLTEVRPDCPPLLARVVATCFAPRPEERPSTLGILCSALKQEARAGGVHDTVVPTAEAEAPAEAERPADLPPEGARRRWGLPVWSGAALAGVLIGLVGWTALGAPGLGREDPPSAEAGVAGVAGEVVAQAPPAEVDLGPPAGIAAPPDTAPPPPSPVPAATTALPVTKVPGCVATEGELIGWWWAGEDLKRNLWGGVRVQRETNVRAAPPDGSGRASAPVRCVLLAGSRVAVRAEPLEIKGQLWVPLYGGDLRKR